MVSHCCSRLITGHSQPVCDRRDGTVHVLCNHMSFVDMTLDLLSHASTLDSQTMLNTVSQLVLSALTCFWQQILDAVLTGHLDQLSLATLRVDRVLPFTCHWVFVEAERVRSLLLVSGLWGVFGEDGGGRIAGEEALQWCGQRLCKPDEL